MRPRPSNVRSGARPQMDALDSPGWPTPAVTWPVLTQRCASWRVESVATRPATPCGHICNGKKTSRSMNFASGNQGGAPARCISSLPKRAHRSYQAADSCQYWRVLHAVLLSRCTSAVPLPVSWLGGGSAQLDLAGSVQQSQLLQTEVRSPSARCCSGGLGCRWSSRCGS